MLIAVAIVVADLSGGDARTKLIDKSGHVETFGFCRERGMSQIKIDPKALGNDYRIAPMSAANARQNFMCSIDRMRTSGSNEAILRTRSSLAGGK